MNLASRNWSQRQRGLEKWLRSDMEGGASYHIPGQDDIEGAGDHRARTGGGTGIKLAWKLGDRGDCLVGRFTKDGGDI